MGLIISKYNEKDLIDECWYDSSTIYYTKCHDKKDEYKDLEVTFKDGRTYIYFKVMIQDYLLLKNGGLDNSQGKALNKFIKKYQFEKLEKSDLILLNERKDLFIEEKEIERLKIIEENKKIINNEKQ